MRKLLTFIMISGMLAFVACSQSNKLADNSTDTSTTEVTLGK